MSYELVMPAMEMDQVSATLLQWLKPVGALVVEGEPLMEIETDKVTVEIEAPVSGILESVRAAPGDVVPVGTLVAVIAAPGEDRAPVPGSQPMSSAPAEPSGQAFADEPAASRVVPMGVLQSRVAARVQQSHAKIPHIFLRRMVDVTALLAATGASPAGSGIARPCSPTFWPHAPSLWSSTRLSTRTLLTTSSSCGRTSIWEWPSQRTTD